MNEGLKVTGRIAWELVRDGVVVERGERDNIITTVGKNALATLLNSASAGTSLVTHIGFGSSTTAVAVGDTALGTELSGGGYARVAVTRSNPSGNVIQYVATLTGLTGVTVQEAGLFSAATSGTLFAHQLTGAVALTAAADSLQITWQVTVS
ncbi:hypothetical protein [Paenibacillus sp. YIM B09110]|uniref:hypothetical protein n=1 Tax=Paenibacillus sp. YIM B09110 TaxID=3126102 RepID=UPI00301E2E8B